MKEGDLGRVFLEHLVMAVPWGIVFLVAFFVAMLGIKQEVKEGIEFGVSSAISETARFAFSGHLAGPIKKHINEVVEFAAKTAKTQLKDLVHDAQVKMDLKELIEHNGKEKQ
ncbi:MAG: hypothetical protein JRJ77_11185 [Deltaproteobacteria bacterium]|nr:hypothetical protein [Deltaproteobacteria bacterium]MBW2341458.1 hypothetical protein [Deltaproteobacteria bacterium]